MTRSSPPSIKPVWLALIAAAALWLLWLHATVLAPFVLSLVLAYALHPMVDKLCAWKLPRALAVTLCLLLVGLIVAVMLVLLVPIVSDLVPMLRDQLPGVLANLWRQATPVLREWGVVVPATPEALQAELVDLVKTHASQWSGAVWKSVMLGGGSLLSIGGLIVLVPMLAFYWLQDWSRFTTHAANLLPRRWSVAARAFLDESDELLGQYLRGQLIVMVILAGYYSLGLTFIGFNLALPIGVFTGLAICIPYLGYGLGLVLAVLAGLLQFGTQDGQVGHHMALLALVYGLGQVIESFFLTPRLVGERIGLHPLGVILALMLFGQWMGLWGVLIALPSSAVLTLLGRHLLSLYRQSAFYRST
jgi:predicted PurR-regulated permease PerM